MSFCAGRGLHDNYPEEQTDVDKLFVNIAVDDLDRSVEFFTSLGFSFWMDPKVAEEGVHTAGQAA
jgi:hypothetical protein